MSQTYFFMTLGSPGSGKTFVCDWLTPKYGALRLASDEIRVAMFGSLRPEFHEEPYSSMISGAMQYASRQALSQGVSVVYDTNSNSAERRRAWSTATQQLGALPILIWVKTPFGIAKQRAIARDIAEGEADNDSSYIDTMAARIEEPLDIEHVIVVNGLDSVEQQQRDFDEQLHKITINNT